MNYLMLMTLSGSILFLGYLCWARLCGSFVTQHMKYYALVAVLLVYVIPWMWLKGVYNSLFELFVGGSFTTGEEMPVSFADIKTGAEAYKTQGYLLEVFIICIWLSGAVFFLVKRLTSYFQGRNHLVGNVENCKNGDTEKIIEGLQKDFHYKRKPEVLKITNHNKTFTIGTRKPVIFLQDEYGKDDLEFILRHEMVHIVRKDILVKLLMEFVCFLHWFNPLIWVLKRELNLVCETSCDEKVISGFSAKAREAYARLLVKSTENGEEKVPLSSGLEDDYKNTKERVILIMKSKSIKRWKKTVAASVFVLMLALNSLTALAYPSVYDVEDATIEFAENTVDGENTFWMFSDVQNGYNMPTNEILYDVQFVDEFGVISPASLDSSTYRWCPFGHNIVSGYIQTHTTDENHVCTVKTYESTRCTRCDTIWVGDLKSTVTYDPCPHY